MAADDRSGCKRPAVRLSVLAIMPVAATITLAWPRPSSSSTITRASGPAPACCSSARATWWWARPRTATRRSSAVRELQPDLVLLDVQLPDIDGPEVAARLAAANGASPAIILTSSRDLEDIGALERRARLHPQVGAFRRGAGGAPMSTRDLPAPRPLGPGRSRIRVRRDRPRADPDQRLRAPPSWARRAGDRLGLHRRRAVRLVAPSRQPRRHADGRHGFAWLLAGLGISDIPLLFALGRPSARSTSPPQSTCCWRLPAGGCRPERAAHRRRGLPGDGDRGPRSVLFVDPRGTSSAASARRTCCSSDNETLVDVVEPMVNVVGAVLVADAGHPRPALAPRVGPRAAALRARCTRRASC